MWSTIKVINWATYNTLCGADAINPACARHRRVSISLRPLTPPPLVVTLRTDSRNFFQFVRWQNPKLDLVPFGRPTRTAPLILIASVVLLRPTAYSNRPVWPAPGPADRRQSGQGGVVLVPAKHVDLQAKFWQKTRCFLWKIRGNFGADDD